MAESTVAAAVQWIGSLLEEAKILLRVEEDVRKLQEKLQVLQEYLQDADARPGQEVRTLTTKVRKLAYQAEDLIDTYILKLTPKTQLSNRNMLVKSTRKVYNSPHTYILGKRIQKLQCDVDQVMKKLDEQEVKRNSHVKETPYPMQWTSKTSYPYDDGAYVVGWENDLQKLVQVLMGQGRDQDKRVVALIGMGGSGKTTMARNLYNHPYVKECFQCRAWVCVSQEWNPQYLLSEILRQIAGPDSQDIKPDCVSKEELVDKVRNILIKKSYLVVLDDVWRNEALEVIIPALAHSKGSKIIITTRNKQIVQFKMSLISYIHEPCPLDEDQGWKLLSRFALKNNLSADYNQVDMSSFEQLGKEMLKQCKGLPLAIVALAGILSTKSNIGEWQKVGNAVRTRVMEDIVANRVGDLLALSYNDLPYYLKPCFLYMGLFPEDCQIPTGMLTRMWAAEGLVASHGNMSIEDVAMLRLEELSHRFLIQVVKTNFKGDIKAVHLHDLLRDLCVKKAQDQSFLRIYTSTTDLTGNGASALTIEPRRVALHSRTTLPTQVSQLRSLVLLAQSNVSHNADVHIDMLESVELGVVHQSFELLRVLNLWGIKTASGTLPEKIGRLIHLRYLGIRATNITKLPRTIGGLTHLLTLDYRNINSNCKVPIIIRKELGKLMQLRHLFLPMDHPWILEDLLKLDAMTSLQTLWGVKQDGSRGGYWLSREVPMLSTSLKKLRVSVSTEQDLEAILRTPSLMSNGDGRLHTLHCELRDGVTLQQLVKPLSDHQHLHKLILIGNISMQLSLLLPANLIRLELKDSMLNNGDPMLALGALAHLKLLKLSNFYVGSFLACALGSFPQLEELYLENLQNLRRWRIQQGAMLCLKKLQITQAKKLEFPSGLEFVTTLQQLEFFGVSKEFRQKAGECGWSPEKLRIPHNCETIIEMCESPVDVSSIRKLYEQLCAGIFLNNKRQRYWVMKQADCYCNCFMVFATDLSIATIVDIDGLSVWDSYGATKADIDDLPMWDTSRHAVWDTGRNAQLAWSDMEERDGMTIKVIKLEWGQGLLKVRGTLNIAYISPEVTYRISHVIMLDTSRSGLEMSFKSLLRFPDGRVQKYDGKLNDRPKNEWIQVLVGEFVISDEEYGELDFILHFQRQPSGVTIMIKGVVIEPKH